MQVLVFTGKARPFEWSLHNNHGRATRRPMRASSNSSLTPAQLTTLQKASTYEARTL